MDALRLRPATRADESDLDAVALAAWEAGIYPLTRREPGLIERERQRFSLFVRAQLSRIIVAEWDGQIAGWIAYAQHRPYVPFLFVAPEVQGHGIGGTLLQRVESLMELKGHSVIALETYTSNQRALRFYERLGYHVHAVKTVGVGAGGTLTSVRLEKPLTPYSGPLPDLDQGPDDK